MIPSMLLLVLLTLLAVGAPALDGPAGVTVAEDPAPRIPGTLVWQVTSPYQEGTNAVEILLPDARPADRRYPVVYILPVNTGTQGQWGHPLEVAKAHDLANRHQVILVCPAFAVLPWFGDNPQRPEMRQSSYVTEVVMPLVEARLPALAGPKGRHLIGFSKSGLGALGLFLRQPERFAAVAVFDNWWGVPNAAQWDAWGFAACYGTRENFDAWDPQRLIGQRKAELGAGPTRITVMGGGPGIRLGVEALEGMLSDGKIPHLMMCDRSWGHTWTSGWLPLAVAAVADAPRD